MQALYVGVAAAAAIALLCPHRVPSALHCSAHCHNNNKQRQMDGYVLDGRDITVVFAQVQPLKFQLAFLYTIANVRTSTVSTPQLSA
jgi:hypothetical protein